MAGKVITSDALARSRSFSPAVKAGPFVYVSGAAPFDGSKDMRGQATEVFEYISRVLAEVEYLLTDVVKVQALSPVQKTTRSTTESAEPTFPRIPQRALQWWPALRCRSGWWRWRWLRTKSDAL